MAFPSPHYLLAWSGTLPGGEQFTGGLRLSPEFSLSSEEDEKSALTDYAGVLSAWWIAANQHPVSNRAALVTVKLNRIGTDGKYERAYTNRIDYAPAKPGSASGLYPNQVAWVSTLETGAVRGLAHRGRIFWPAPSASTSTDGLVSQVITLAAANSVAGLINSLNAVRPGARVCVYSAGSVTKGTPGTSREVTGVSMGRALDTIRARRTSVLEQRQVATTAITP